MKLSPLKTIALAALAICGSAAYADTAREVECANGRTVKASGTETDAAACLTIGSKPAEARGFGLKYNDIELKPPRAADDAKARKYQQLAAKNKPKTREQEQLIKQYMKLPPSQRNGFKTAHPNVQHSIWDYGPYAVCFYASVAGGADVVEAGDECHADWVE